MSEPGTEPVRGAAWRAGLGSGLRAQLGGVRRKLVWVEVLRRLAVALSVGVVGLSIFLGIDWLVDLSMDVRGAILAGLISLTGLLVLYALAAVVTQRRDDESIALMVERAAPGFRSRLISAVQFARGKGTLPDEGVRPLVERMVAETEDFAASHRLGEVVKTVALKRAVIVFAVVGVTAAGGYVAGGAITRDLLKRAFLADLPVPRATQVIWTTGDVTTGIGDAVRIEARVRGFEPEHGTLRVRFASGRHERVRMRKVDGTGARYAATLENVRESFTYVAALHDGRSERYAGRALPRPEVMEVRGRQTYPPYTNLPPSTHQPGEMLLFPGSHFELTIEASQPLRGGAVRLLGGQALIESGVDENDPRVLRASFVAPDGGVTGFTVELLDREGMASQDTTVYRIDMLRDEPPTVRVVKPSRPTELVTPKARVLLGYEVEDRFGIGKLSLQYIVSRGPTLMRTRELPLERRGAKKVEGTFDWSLEEVDPPLRAGDEVEYWVEASDQNERTPSGISSRRVLKVVTAREKRDDLLSRVGDSLGRIDQAADDQERLNAVLADWIRSQASESLQPKNTNGNQE